MVVTMCMVFTVLIIITPISAVYGYPAGNKLQVTEGDTVRLPCNRTDEHLNETVDWKFKRDERDIYIVSKGELLSRRRPKFDLEVSDYTLIIQNITVNDTGFYYCTENAGFGKQHFTHVHVGEKNSSTDVRSNTATGTDDVASKRGILVIIVAALLVAVATVVVICLAVSRYMQRRASRSTESKPETHDEAIPEVELERVPLQPDTHLKTTPLESQPFDVQRLHDFDFIKLGIERGAFGVAFHLNYIFVLPTYTDVISVLKDSDPYQKVGDIRVNGIINPSDLLAFNNYLYVPDNKTPENCSRAVSQPCLWCIPIDDRAEVRGEIKEYMRDEDQDFDPFSVSLTYEDYILITTRSKYLFLCTTDGKKLKKLLVNYEPIVDLPHEEKKILRHAVQLSQETFIVCGKLKTMGVCKMRLDGDTLEPVEQPADSNEGFNAIAEPEHMALIEDNIFVVERIKSRMLLYHEDLRSSTFEELLNATKDGIKRPCRLCYDKKGRRLLVAFHLNVGLYRVTLKHGVSPS